MKSTADFKSERNNGGSYPMLPKGLYIAQIKGVKVEDDGPDQRLTLRLDIVEGEYAGYYTKRYNADQERGGQFEVKYKGDFVLYGIVDKKNTNRSYPDSDIKKFNGSIWAVEQSNPGYHWDCNEQGLKGKYVGINVRMGTYNGNQYTTIGRLESIPEIREGKVNVMQDAKPRGSAVQTETTSNDGFTQVDEEVPF